MKVWHVISSPATFAEVSASDPLCCPLDCQRTFCCAKAGGTNRNWKKLIWTRIANAYQNFRSREGLANSSFCTLIIPCDSVDKQYQSWIDSEDDLQTGRQWESKRLLNQWNVLLEFSLTYYKQIGWIENGIIHLVISCLLISGIPYSRSHQDNTTFLSTNGNTHRAWSCVIPLEGQWNLQGLLYLLNPWECHGPRLKGW